MVIAVEEEEEREGSWGGMRVAEAVLIPCFFKAFKGTVRSANEADTRPYGLELGRGVRL